MKSSSLSERVTIELRNAIAWGNFNLGEALSEEALAAAFKISRTPVREALARLQLEGLVVVVPKSGTYVFIPTERDVVELCEHRATLEIEACRRSLERGRTATLNTLREAWGTMEQACATFDVEAYTIANTSFHLGFFDHCDNRHLRDAYHAIVGRITALRTHLAVKAGGMPLLPLVEHGIIVELVAANDYEKLRDTLTSLILRMHTEYAAFLASHENNDVEDRVKYMRRKLSMSGV